MNVIDVDQAVDIALTALLNNRLAVLCGAGLSMAPPSNLPSAAKIAADAKQKYDAQYGGIRPELSTDIEEQATFFLGRGELATVYLRTLVDRNIFATTPNDGHKAIADLLLAGGVELAISTNVDTLIETAGTLLHGQIGYGFERSVLAALPPDVSPLLKIHGCWGTNLESTIWTSAQLLVEPFATRIAQLTPWVSTHLQDRDLVIIGFWTDWPYLNNILQETLGEVRPARVVVVDLSDGDWLATKAPSLNALGERAEPAFYHVRASGAVFLRALRIQFSKSYVRQVLAAGSVAYIDIHGAPADAAWFDLPDMAADDLWQLRRDLEGCRPNAPSSEIVPDDEPLLGATILSLRAHGATIEGSLWKLGDRTLRVLKTPLQLLSAAESAFVGDTAPAASAQIVIAVGAANNGLPFDIVRASTDATIARGGLSRWLTREEAIEELALV